MGADYLTFQFHKGTIKTNVIDLLSRLVHSFQFHKGTIKTLLKTGDPSSLRNFNSIKVRLKRIENNGNNFIDTISIP